MEEMLENLTQITGPLGPMVSFEQRLAACDAWVNGLMEKDLQLLNAILMMKPEELERDQLDAEEVFVQVAEGLVVLAEAYPDDVLQILGDQLMNPTLTTILLDAIGNWGSMLAMPLLERAAEKKFDEEIAVSIASAAGMIGGDRAMDLLAKLEARYPDLEMLKQEIEIARENMN